MAHSALINVMSSAARSAGRRLIRDFNEVEQLQVSKKGPGDFVSQADHASEEILINELSEARPGFSFLVEEQGLIKGDDPDSLWIIDPLDGTLNFLHAIPHFSISIALQHKKEIVAGLVYNPISDETYFAEKGRGAYLNNKRLRVSARSSMADAVMATGIPTIRPRVQDGHELFQAEVGTMMTQCAGIMRMGSAALDLAYVAAGRFEGYWERKLGPWDVAAGIILVKEAGGLVSDFESSNTMLKTGNIVAANDRLHGPLLKELGKAKRLVNKPRT